jgi:hypothetical protein
MYSATVTLKTDGVPVVRAQASALPQNMNDAANVLFNHNRERQWELCRLMTQASVDSVSPRAYLRLMGQRVRECSHQFVDTYPS